MPWCIICQVLRRNDPTKFEGVALNRVLFGGRYEFGSSHGMKVGWGGSQTSWALVRDGHKLALVLSLHDLAREIIAEAEPLPSRVSPPPVPPATEPTPPTVSDEAVRAVQVSASSTATRQELQVAAADVEAHLQNRAAIVAAQASASSTATFPEMEVEGEDID